MYNTICKQGDFCLFQLFIRWQVITTLLLKAVSRTRIANTVSAVTTTFKCNFTVNTPKFQFQEAMEVHYNYFGIPCHCFIDVWHTRPIQ
jgi:hypothetical protein